MELFESGALQLEFCHEACCDVPAHHRIFGSFYLVCSNQSNFERVDVKYIYQDSMRHIFEYTPFCDDFGPLNLASVYQFCRVLEDMFLQFPDSKIALQTSEAPAAATNAVFLIGSYMIMALGKHPNEIESAFSGLELNLQQYKDVSPDPQDFHLNLKDCWSGLWRAKTLTWVDFGPSNFDLDEYSELDHPLNADLHEVVPKKFIAMRGPKRLPGDAIYVDRTNPDGSFSHRDFSPRHYIDILRQFDVQAVMRLNFHEYNEKEFLDGGIAVADLYFDDCSVPPPDVVVKFLMIAEALPGAIAVHCAAGLGRTGTLIALYMMKHHGFSAREAIGWLRIVRPGSVIGRQQLFLCQQEGLMRRGGQSFRPDGLRVQRQIPSCDPRKMTAGEVKKLVKRIIMRVDRRFSRLRTSLLAPLHEAKRPASAGDAAMKDQDHDLLVPTAAPPAEEERRRGSGEKDKGLGLHVSAAAERRCRERGRAVARVTSAKKNTLF